MGDHDGGAGGATLGGGTKPLFERHQHAAESKMMAPFRWPSFRATTIRVHGIIKTPGSRRTLDPREVGEAQT